MPIGTNISVIAAGAILAFATHVHLPILSVAAVGAVLMAVGAAGLALRLAALLRQRSLTVAQALPSNAQVLVRPYEAGPGYGSYDNGIDNGPNGDGT